MQKATRLAVRESRKQVLYPYGQAYQLGAILGSLVAAFLSPHLASATPSAAIVRGETPVREVGTLKAGQIHRLPKGEEKTASGNRPWLKDDIQLIPTRPAPQSPCAAGVTYSIETSELISYEDRYRQALEAEERMYRQVWRISQGVSLTRELGGLKVGRTLKLRRSVRSGGFLADGSRALVRYQPPPAAPKKDPSDCASGPTLSIPLTAFK